MNSDPNLQPERMLGYFESLADGRPETAQWAAGARLTRQWIGLMAEKRVEQAAVNDLLAELEANPTPCSGWLDLWLRVRYWARTTGFDVPERNPWAR